MNDVTRTSKESVAWVTSHDWTGPTRVIRHVHCTRCGKLFEILKAKGECRGKPNE